MNVKKELIIAMQTLLVWIQMAPLHVYAIQVLLEMAWIVQVREVFILTIVL